MSNHRWNALAGQDNETIITWLDSFHEITSQFASFGFKSSYNVEVFFSWSCVHEPNFLPTCLEIVTFCSFLLLILGKVHSLFLHLFCFIAIFSQVLLIFSFWMGSCWSVIFSSPVMLVSTVWHCLLAVSSCERKVYFSSTDTWALQTYTNVAQGLPLLQLDRLS